MGILFRYLPNKVCILGLMLAVLFAQEARVFAKGPPKVSVAVYPSQIKVPPLRKVELQKPERIQLENGMILLLQPDHELPMISMNILVRGGTLEEPAEKVGLVEVYGQTWLSGGTKTATGDQLQEYFEKRAIIATSLADTEKTLLSLRCLKEHFDEASVRFFDVLRNPMFREEKITLAKKQILTALAIEKDDPQRVTLREANKLVYGQIHPLARYADPTTLARVQRKDLLEWHRNHVYPNQIMILVSGDFNSKEMEQTLRQQFDAWRRGPAYQEPTLSFAKTSPGLFFVSKKDVTQSNIIFVQLGQTKKNPDYYALEVLNQIIDGNAMTGRFFEHLRAEQGLAYHTQGGIGIDWKFPSITYAYLGTQSQSTVKAVKAIYKEIEGFIEHAPTKEEVELAKERLLNSFVFRFQNKMDVLSNLAELELNSYPSDWTERFPEEIKKVTVEDVNRAISKYLQAKDFAVLVVGNEDDFGTPLSTLGPVTKLKPKIDIGRKIVK